MDKTEYLSKLEQLLNDKEQSKQYIEACLSYAGRLLDNNLPVIFDIKHLSLLIGIDVSELSKMMFADYCFYKECSIPKKNGGSRILFIPAMQLKYIQRWILDNILSSIKVSTYATGFSNNKSIVTNAKIHVGKDCVLNMDLENFFPAIKYEDIFRIFVYYGYTKEISYTLAKLCTYEGVLPQGSPASPYLSNIVCLKLDKRLSELAKTYNADYTRYADDITFSGSYGIQKCKSIIAEIVNNEGFNINDKKSRIAYKYQKQEVTGMTVNNNTIRVDKEYKRKLSQEIYYCTKFGVSDHMRKINCNKWFYKDHIYGKAYFINMVEPNEGKKLFSLLEKIQWDY